MESISHDMFLSVDIAKTSKSTENTLKNTGNLSLENL